MTCIRGRGLQPVKVVQVPSGRSSSKRRQEAVSDLALCTCCNPAEFFSYRAEGAHSGRMMAVICRTRTGKQAEAVAHET